MNTIQTLKQIFEISSILADVEYRLGQINCLASALLDIMSETNKPDTTVTAADDSPDAVYVDAKVAPVTPPRTKSGKMPYIRADNILDYIWEHDGSVRMEYLLRDLYYDRKGAERLATTTLLRMEMLAIVHLDRDENSRIQVITACKMPKD